MVAENHSYGNGSKRTAKSRSTNGPGKTTISRFVNPTLSLLVEGLCRIFLFCVVPPSDNSYCIPFRDGSYGLYLDDTLFQGTSARSITFANEILCSDTGPRLAGGAVGFECVGVEVWSVVS